MLQDGTFDIVLLDLAMPEFSGFDVLEGMKKEGIIDKAKIVLLTASSITDQEIEKLLKPG